MAQRARRPAGPIHPNQLRFREAPAELETRRLAPLPHPLADGELYCYPACYTAVDQGNHLAWIRLEEQQAAHKRMRGAGTTAGLGCGQTFSLTGYPRKDQNDKYLVLAVEHELWADAYRSNSSGGEQEPYLCAIEVQPAAVSFRPPLVTPKPVMAGPETAMVTGPAGEEIWTDKYGRVKVQFPWDRLGKNDENSSLLGARLAGLGRHGLQYFTSPVIGAALAGRLMVVRPGCGLSERGGLLADLAACDVPLSGQRFPL